MKEDPKKSPNKFREIGLGSWLLIESIQINWKLFVLKLKETQQEGALLCSMAEWDSTEWQGGLAFHVWMELMS